MKIYLAGPDVFRKDAIEHLESLKELCKKYEFEGLAPLDNVIDIPDDDKWTPKHSNLIFKANMDLIRQCDVIIANIVPFRGACIDDGTAWEIGAGFSLGKKIYGYSKLHNKSLVQITEQLWDMNDYYGQRNGYGDEYPIVENFGNGVNLMICDSIKDSGGMICETFEDCLSILYINHHKI